MVADLYSSVYVKDSVCMVRNLSSRQGAQPAKSTTKRLSKNILWKPRTLVQLSHNRPWTLMQLWRNRPWVVFCLGSIYPLFVLTFSINHYHCVRRINYRKLFFLRYVLKNHLFFNWPYVVQLFQSSPLSSCLWKMPF